MGKLVWVRPSGSEITTNDSDASIEAAAQLGWKPKEETKAETVEHEKRGPGRPRRAE